MWITGSPIQVLLHKYKVEQTEIISRLLFTNHKVHEHLVGTFTIS